MEMEIRAAVKTGDVTKLQKLLDTGVHLDTKDQDERTPLHWACASSRLDVAEFLLEQVHASIDVQDDAKWTPLMSAVSAGYNDVLGLLLSRGVDAKFANVNRQIPLHYHKGKQEITELLLHYTKHDNHADNTGSTPLMRALGGKPSLAIIAQLVDHGAKVDCRDVDGNTPLHLAISEGYEDIARYLLDFGADRSAKNNEEKRCVDLANFAFKAEIHAIVSKRKECDVHL